MMRVRICRNLGFLGFDLSADRNRDVADWELLAIGAGHGKRVRGVPNDEERQIARETFVLLAGSAVRFEL